MRKLGTWLSMALILGLAATSMSAWADSGSVGPNPVEDRQILAFTLDEMNCFSSDIRARAVPSETAAAEHAGTVIATESGGGTNGIPCDRRDPKAHPKKRART
jgi:hypothetical protein